MRFLRHMLLLAGMPMVLASCAIDTVREPAEKALAEQVQELLNRESLAFDGEAQTTTGRVGMVKQELFHGTVTKAGDPVVHVKPSAQTSRVDSLDAVWNPRRSLERLTTIPKAVRWSGDGNHSQSLLVQTDSATAKRLLLEDWDDGLVRMEEAERQKAKQLAHGQPELLPAWLQEIEQAAAGMRTKLRHQTETLHVETAYRLELDQQTRSPRRLTVEKRFHSAIGATEGQIVTYTFTDPSAIPPARPSSAGSQPSMLYLDDRDR